MRFAVELSHVGRRFVYEIAFEWPPNFREARVLEEVLAVNGADVFRRNTRRSSWRAASRPDSTGTSRRYR